MCHLIYYKEYECLGGYALYTFSIYYSLFIIGILRAIYVLFSYFSFGRTEPLLGDNGGTLTNTGLAYDIGIINDPLDIVDHNIGKFGFKKFIEQLEKNPKNFDIEDFLKKNEAAIEHLQAGVDEINGFKYIFVRQLDFTFNKDADLKFREDKCCICMGEYHQGEFALALGECPHHFHWECVQAWLRKSVKCPLCKNSMRKDMLRSIAELQKMMA